MSRIKITMNFEYEYEPDPSNYPLGSTIDEMIAIDVANAHDDPYLFIDMDGSNTSITGEAV